MLIGTVKFQPPKKKKREKEKRKKKVPKRLTTNAQLLQPLNQARGKVHMSCVRPRPSKGFRGVLGNGEKCNPRTIHFRVKSKWMTVVYWTGKSESADLRRMGSDSGPSRYSFAQRSKVSKQQAAK